MPTMQTHSSLEKQIPMFKNPKSRRLLCPGWVTSIVLKPRSTLAAIFETDRLAWLIPLAIIILLAVSEALVFSHLRYDLYGENNTLAADELYYLVHVVDSNGHCQEQMASFRKAGRVSPFIFMGQDGVTGIIDSTGETRIMQVDTSVCSLEDTRSLGGGSGGYYIFSSLLGSYLRTLELIDETQSAFGESRFNAWFAREGEKEVFIVHYAGTNVRQAVSTDPEIGQSVPIESILRWDAYDLASGRPLRSWEETTLSNGKITSSEVRYALDYYPELPEELRVALD